MPLIDSAGVSFGGTLRRSPNRGSLVGVPPRYWVGGGGGGGGGGSYPEGFITELDFSVDPGTSWEVLVDGEGNPLSVYDKIWITLTNTDGVPMRLQVLDSTDTWREATDDYTRPFRTDNGSSTNVSSAALIRHLTSAGTDNHVHLMLQNFGLPVSMTGYGSEHSPNAGERTIEWELMVKDPGPLKGLRLTADSALSTGKGKIKGKKK